MAPVLVSLKSSPSRSIALNDGAPKGLSDTACSAETCSSEGTATLMRTAMPSQPKMMGTDNRWMIRATRDRAAGCWVSNCSVLMWQSTRSR